MDTLHLSLFQANINWKSVSSNLLHYESCLAKRNIQTDVLIFPEMFNTGFVVDTIQLAESMDGESVSFLRRIAHKFDTAVVASLAIKEKKHYYNRLLWVNPNGSIQSYDKKHLFRMASEEQLLTKGKEQLLIEYKGWRFLPLICYDLRFPVWSRNGRKGDSFLYDCLLYIANWPSGRMSVFNTLLKARAIENQAFVIAVNRVGNDGNNLHYIGESQIIDPIGQRLLHASHEETLIDITLHKDELQHYRTRFRYLDWIILPYWMNR